MKVDIDMLETTIREKRVRRSESRIKSEQVIGHLNAERTLEFTLYNLSIRYVIGQDTGNN